MNNIERLRRERGWSRPILAEKMGTSYQQVEKLEKGERRLAQDWIDRAAAAFGVTPAAIISDDEQHHAAPPRPTPTASVADSAPNDAPVMVGIEHIDLAYGLGATFTDRHVEVEVLDFPRQWVEAITISPPSLLTWARGKGDSMIPTINDGDLVLLDRSQRDVREQDALWAITIGDTGSIKRLRKKGDRFQIFSDNPAVPPDEEPIDFVNVVARVVFVGRRT